MTIAGHEAPNLAHWLEVLVTDMPDPFWDDVKKHVASWAIIAGIGGIGYLAVSVPVRLDKVLSNQEALQAEVRSAQRDLAELEVRTEALERRGAQ